MPNFPTSLDALSNPADGDYQDSATVPHAAQHATANDILEALEAKLGITASTPAVNKVLLGDGAGSSKWDLVPAAALAAEAWTVWTPMLYQGGTVTAIVNVARYKKFGRLAVVQLALTATAAGTAANYIAILGIPAAIYPLTARMVGGFRFVGDIYANGIAIFDDSMVMSFYRDAITSQLGVSDVTLANGNILEAVLSYETAT